MLLACGLGGCLKVEQTLSLAANGSGRFSLTYAMSERCIELLRVLGETARLAGQPLGQAGETNLVARLPFEEAAVRRLFQGSEAHGVEVRHVSVSALKAWRHVSVELDFRDLAGLAALPALKDYAFLAAAAGGRHTLTVVLPKQELQMPAGPMDLDTERAAAALTAGFRVTLTVVVPGRVLETNGRPRGDRDDTVVWVWNLDEATNAVQQASGYACRVVYE